MTSPDESSVDTSQLRELVAVFGEIEKGMLKKVDGVVGRAGFNVKTEAVRRVSGYAHLPKYPKSISYDQFHGLGVSGVVIGPDKNRPQGALGNIIEDGSPTSEPIPHLAPAAALEAPRFEQALAILHDQLWNKL